MWGTSARQRLRLAPLYLALRAAALARATPSAAAECPAAWRPGLSVVIPERDAPDMLGEALGSLQTELEGQDEPVQVVVVANGATPGTYGALAAKYAHVEWLEREAPLGFSAAIALGLAEVRHEWTLLLNNDMTFEPGALAQLLRHRGGDVFSLSAQILQQSSDGRREETGFTDWYADGAGVHAYHAPVPADGGAVPHLAGSGGATIFRTRPLTRYVKDTDPYDPFYWEDIEWGVRAWRDGYRVLFCPGAVVRHRHRATTARFYAPAVIDRIVARNGLLFDARNRATAFGADWLMSRVCDQPYESQRELAQPRIAIDVRRRRADARGRTRPDIAPVLVDPRHPVSELAPASFSYRLATFTAGRPRLLLVTPFAVFPPRHGGARRISGLLAYLRRDFDIILVTDEATLYDARSFAFLDGLCAVHLVQREREANLGSAAGLEARLRSHDHPALAAALRAALARYQPALVQIEFAELAPLVRERAPGQRWVLALHDAYGAADFATPEAAQRFEREVLARYDAVTVVAAEDGGLVQHRDVVCVPNASSIEPGPRAPSASARLLFMGPFRYEPNFAGVRAFLRDALPAIKAAVPEVRLRVLGGDGAPRRVAADPLFARDDVDVFEHREDVEAQLAACALTINPLAAIRGSPVKLVESLAAGRVCVSTAEGARGFRDEGFAGLVIVESVAAMAPAIVSLLRDNELRLRLESADAMRLARFTWAASAAVQRALYLRLLQAADA